MVHTKILEHKKALDYAIEIAYNTDIKKSTLTSS